MSIGEMEYTDLRYAEGNKDFNFKLQNSTDGKGEPIKSLEWEVYFGRLIFLAFAFLFVVVVMNLLNAIAIGDIQENIFFFKIAN